jgi:hypothetical protein
MPKLSKALGNLQGKGKTERKKDEIALNSAVSTNVASLITKIENGLQALNNASNESRQRMATLLLQEIAKIAPVIAQSATRLEKRVDGLEKRLAQTEQLSRDNVKAILAGTEAAVMQNLAGSGKKLDKLATRIDAVGSDIGKISFPQTDLTGVQEMLEDVVRRVDGIEIPAAMEFPQPKEEWTFDVVHFVPGDPDSGIKKVVVS